MFIKHTIPFGVCLVLVSCGAFALAPAADGAGAGVAAVLDSAPSTSTTQSSVPAAPSQVAHPVDPLAAPSGSVAVPITVNPADQDEKGGVGVSSRIAEYQMSTALEKAKAEYLNAKKERTLLEAEIGINNAQNSPPPAMPPEHPIPAPVMDATPVKKEGFAVEGIFGSGHSVRASISRTVNEAPAGGPVIVAEGDSLDGWKVLSISEHGVCLVKGAKIKTLRYTN